MFTTRSQIKGCEGWKEIWNKVTIKSQNRKLYENWNLRMKESYMGISNTKFPRVMKKFDFEVTETNWKII